MVVALLPYYLDGTNDGILGVVVVAVAVVVVDMNQVDSTIAVVG